MCVFLHTLKNQFICLFIKEILGKLGKLDILSISFFLLIPNILTWDMGNNEDNFYFTLKIKISNQ